MKKIVLLTALFSMLYAASAYATITASKHNLSSTQPNTAANVYTPDTNEVCVFCHTPHGGTQDAPLWNRGMAPAIGYTPYSSSTIDVNSGVIPAPDGISLACLSCHDGTIALDALRNAPGSGGFSSTPVSQGWTFNNLTGTQGGPPYDTANSLPESPDRWVTNLTRNLADDHPISMPYPTTTQDPKFTQNFITVGAARFIDENSNNRADDNEIKLYRTGTDYKVQCATCHNPHGTEQSPGVDFPTFLRKTNSASALCTTCHIK